ncbi:MAG: EAL domain-containing protein, partial [Gammaproteobacteria bacterium]
DTLGHHIGDLLLQKLALRMREALRDSDTIARLGGDEFAILMPTIEDAQHAALATKKLLTLLEIPLLLEEHSLTIGASIGIALFPEHGNDKGTLMRRADMAMYSAKRTHSGYAIYHLSLDQQSPEERSLIEELHRACEHNKFVLYFKPQIAAHTGKVETIEALLHWQHPGRGLLMPSQFISTAEKCGLINPISLWVLQEAANQCRRWQQLGFDIPVNISLSDHYLQDPGMPHSILKVWENSGIDSACLELEISESAIVEDPVYLSSVIQRLHNMGVRIVIGAYGSAPSSLIYLHDLPIYRIKIDTSLISNVADNDSFALLQTTIKLAQDMGHTVIAEGAENAEIQKRLAAQGNAKVRHYHVTEPLAAADLLIYLLKTQQPSA